jgi:tRNA(adenine34) deaminase
MTIILRLRNYKVLIDRYLYRLYILDLEIDIFSDEYFMRQAFIEAQKAAEEDEIPVGAVVVSNKRIIGRAHNLTERLIDVTAHAEMQAITSASSYLGSKYLKGCTLYVTLEPCPMCAGALFWTQIDRVVFAASDEKRGFIKYGGSLHPKTKIEQGLMATECSEILKQFFESKRS